MTRETKAGMLMILMLAGVFGFMVYKRLHQPAAAMAQQNEPDDATPEGDTAPVADAAPVQSDPFLADTQPAAVKPAPATAIPTQIKPSSASTAGEPDPSRSDDPFGEVTTVESRPKPKLPTAIDDPFDEPPAKIEQAATDSVQSAQVRTISAPEPATSAPTQEFDPFAATASKSTTPPPNTARPAAFSEPDPFEADEATPAKASLNPPTPRSPVVNETADLPNSGGDDPFAAGPPSNTSPTVSDGFEAPVVVKDRPEIEVKNSARAAALPSDDPFATESQLEVQQPANNPKVQQMPAPQGIGAEAPKSAPAAAVLEPAIEDAFDSPPQRSTVPALTIPSRDHMPKDVSAQDDDRFGGFRPAAPPARTVDSFTHPSAAPSITAETPPRRTGRPAPVSQIDEDFGATSSARPLIAGDTYQVEPSDNFWTISRKKYGTGRYFMALAQHNAQVITDPKRMKPGVTIATPSAQSLEQSYPNLIPKAAAAVDPIQTASAATPAFTAQAAPAPLPSTELAAGFFVATDGTPMYRVGSEDTLSGIAQRHLGRSSRWVQVFELNRDVLTDGNTLKIGTLLRLPADASRVDMVGGVRTFR